MQAENTSGLSSPSPRYVHCCGGEARGEGGSVATPSRFLALTLVALGLIVGCGSPDVAFVLNREGQEPKDDADTKEMRALHDRVIVDVLYTMFGTPDEPVAWGGQAVSGLDAKKLLLAAGPANDSQGRGLYRKHCVHCHGVSGDGYGPTARFLNPYPRDFRQGIFKFKSTAPVDMPPTREDLMRTIREGINGTAMPSFKVLLRSDEIEALAEYVVYLTLRGLAERALRTPHDDRGIVDDVIKPEDYRGLDDDQVADKLEAAYADQIIPALNNEGHFQRWREAANHVFIPPPRDEAAIAKLDGVAFFRGAPGPDGKPRVECMKCHGGTALGDGDSARETFDKWNEPKWNLIKAGAGPETIEERFNLPLQRLQPRNLRLGIYRGGRRPVDIFRRIAVGIDGTGMPAHASIRDGKMDSSDATKLKAEEIWALVDYIRSLPYQEDGELRRAVAEAPRKERP